MSYLFFCYYGICINYWDVEIMKDCNKYELMEHLHQIEINYGDTMICLYNTAPYRNKATKTKCEIK